MNGQSNALGGSGSRNAREEQVMYYMDPDHPDSFTPRISVATTKASGKVEKTFRQFEASDMERVLDYEDCVDAPSDGILMVGEDDGNGGYKFPNRHCCLRGNFVFYFDTEDVDDKSGPYSTYHAPPLGVIPLDNIDIQFPPGGRRVFREHAHTDARNGYEYVVLHEPPELSDDEDNAEGGEIVAEKKEVDPAAEGEEGDQPEEPAGPSARPPMFLVALSLGERQQWAEAIESRSKNAGQPTMLRASYSTSRATGSKGDAKVASVRQDASQGDRRKSTKTGDKEGKGKSLFDSDDTEVTSAVNEFGANGFSEIKWMDTFFENNNDYDAPDKCDQMEHLQASIKKNLKAAVLEQYEYFVQASGEMTTMGKEVSSLKSLVETQMETIRDMKEIDFSGTLRDFSKDVPDGMGMEEDGFKTNGKKGRRRQPGPFGDEESEISSVLDDLGSNHDFMRGIGKNGANQNQADAPNETTEDPAQLIEVPTWLDEVGEEVAAFVKESRYTDAIDLWTKAKSEIAELLDKHENPVQLWLSSAHQTQLRALQKTLDTLSNQMAHRLEESLRRKNEALKQASKRERSDPRGSMAPIVSPCCLEDDALPLQLLVRLGKTQEAAASYSARRSLLLLESLHEQPISGAGNVDLVIYSAQLSQSFFSCLASAVEGFLDLFMAAAPSLHGEKEDSSLGSSLHSSSTSKNIPAGAVASVVLWCDGELSKFASAFGGARILANLALSPPPRNAGKQPRVVDGHLDPSGNKERQNAIEVAAQCVDQAFSCASQNLDSVGLPLTPRLAEYIRSRLKGCEAEVATLLSEQWSHVTLDWQNQQMDENGDTSVDV
ncbi:expressed unknown protein [Seminavis robusta]|uniref:PH domain-containing protein n=1 Tax=Seminavis robusta TaxID=568900 RepID=A0A9N8DUA9_9STRA|nr:expressed unknown protein [Seminavis robusta]|eukprot:Sro348_g123270.1 n/a (830) ;mRNA; f:51948-54777